jgi:hypothetical protein
MQQKIHVEAAATWRFSVSLFKPATLVQFW